MKSLLTEKRRRFLTGVLALGGAVGAAGEGEEMRGNRGILPAERGVGRELGVVPLLPSVLLRLLADFDGPVSSANSFSNPMICFFKSSSI